MLQNAAGPAVQTLVAWITGLPYTIGLTKYLSRADPSPDPLPGELLSMEQLFSLPIEQTQDPSEPAVTAREIRQSRRNAHMRPSLLGSDPAFAGNGSTFRMVRCSAISGLPIPAAVLQRMSLFR